MEFFTSVIPDGVLEIPGNADWVVSTAETANPGVGNNVGFRVNDTTSGSSIKVDTVGGQTVTFDNCSNGEDFPIRIKKVYNTGTDLDSIHLYYIAG
jgi:hypothetical protein